jgi:hypothetical protein
MAPFQIQANALSNKKCAADCERRRNQVVFTTSKEDPSPFYRHLATKVGSRIAVQRPLKA